MGRRNDIVSYEHLGDNYKDWAGKDHIKKEFRLRREEVLCSSGWGHPIIWRLNTEEARIGNYE